MGQFIVSARKYRPKEFKEVVGQESITETLSRAITAEKIAQAFCFVVREVSVKRLPLES